MKRKLFLATLISVVLVCLFAIGVSAATTNEFGTVETVSGISEKSVFGADGTEAGYTTRVVLFDGTEYHTYPAYYIFTNDVNTTTNFKELNDATGKNYGKKSVIRAEVPHNVQKVTGDIFNGYNDLKYVRFPDTLKEISGNMFYTAHGLEWTNVPRDCVSIGAYAFYGCSSLKTIDMSNAKSLKRTEANQFYNCPNLEELIFPEGFEYFGGGGGGGQTFQNGLGSLKKLYLPDSVTYMGTISEMKSIGTFVVPQGVTSLKSAQFSYCTGLNKIIVHKGVTSVASNAFDMTYYLQEIVYTGEQGETDNAVVTSLKSYTSPNYGKPTFTYGNHCEYYYNNVHDIVVEAGNTCCGICDRCGSLEMFAEPKHNGVWSFGGKDVKFTNVINAECKCTYCETVVDEETIEAILTSYGYSVENGGTGVYQQTKINKTELQKYTAITGEEFDYGIFAGIATVDEGNPLLNGESGIVPSEKTVFASFANTEYTLLQIKVTGLVDGAKIYCGAYIMVGEDIVYLSDKTEAKFAKMYTATM
jgi:hypothetical protein